MSSDLKNQAWDLKKRAWVHNALTGSNAMALSHVRRVQGSDSTTRHAKQLAGDIEEKLRELAVALKERVD